MSCNYILKSGRSCKNKRSSDTFPYCMRHISVVPPLATVEPESECGVCFEPIGVQLPCGHFVHKECVIRSGKRTCPVCRTELPFTKVDLGRISAYNRQLNPTPTPSSSTFTYNIHFMLWPFTVASSEASTPHSPHSDAESAYESDEDADLEEFLTGTSTWLPFLSRVMSSTGLGDLMVYGPTAPTSYTGSV